MVPLIALEDIGDLVEIMGLFIEKSSFSYIIHPASIVIIFKIYNTILAE